MCKRLLRQFFPNWKTSGVCHGYITKRIMAYVVYYSAEVTEPCPSTCGPRTSSIGVPWGLFEKHGSLGSPPLELFHQDLDFNKSFWVTRECGARSSTVLFKSSHRTTFPTPSSGRACPDRALPVVTACPLL